jgi:hypothetical protein
MEEIKNLLMEAIKNQKMVDVNFRKESSREWVNREIAPYDIFEKEDKNGVSREVLLGYCWDHGDGREDVIQVYLDNIDKVDLLEESFSGSEVEQLINPKKPPVISRNWY